MYMNVHFWLRFIDHLRTYKTIDEIELIIQTFHLLKTYYLKH